MALVSQDIKARDVCDKLLTIYTGLDIMYDKLQQGLQETEQILTIARLRADAEDAYGQKLGDISDAVDRIDEGFDRDEGASLKRVITPLK